MGLHSEIGASSMHRWENCPGSVRLSRGAPRTSSKYAEEGTRAHDLAAKKLIQCDVDESSYPPEMVSAVESYVNVVLADARYPSSVVNVESPFSHPDFHAGFFGTADAWSYSKEKRLVRVYDFKYGKGHFVKVEENVQLLYYALGVVLSWPRMPINEIECVIVQPRMPRKKGITHRWRFTHPETLIDFAIRFQKAAERTEDPNSPLVEGAWCFFCPVNQTCPQRHSAKVEKARDTFSDWEGL